MTDTVSKEIRSRIMSKIKGKDTSPELRLRKELWRIGYRYKKDYKSGPYRIDVAFPRAKLAIMVDGCFWHACPRHFKMPKSNKRYWIKKIGDNRKRDNKFNNFMRVGGWMVIRLWEHDINNNLAGCMKRIKSEYTNLCT
jgi:DNA mismatch endonuclease (patch repair protein)